MGVIIEAVIPTSVQTRDSLELWVFSNIALKNQNTSAAMTAPLTEAAGALIHMLLVAGILEKIIPKAPKAVTKEAKTVGLKKEIPGMPL